MKTFNTKNELLLHAYSESKHFKYYKKRVNSTFIGCLFCHCKEGMPTEKEIIEFINRIENR